MGGYGYRGMLAPVRAGRLYTALSFASFVPPIVLTVRSQMHRSLTLLRFASDTTKHRSAGGRRENVQ